MSKLNILLIGAEGRLGSSISKLTAKDSNFKIHKITEKNKKDFLTFSKSSLKKVVLDVSLPNATAAYLEILLSENIKLPYVIGCTGWKDAELKTVKKYSAKNAVVLAANFSPMVNLMNRFLETHAEYFKDWGYSSSIHETHHVLKKDIPSGTALMLKAALKKSLLKNSLKDTPIHSTRAGQVIGEHEVKLIGPFDQLKISHEAFNRDLFAQGALLAAKWAGQAKKAGLFSMTDVLF